MQANYKDFLHLHFLVLIWGFTAILGVLITVPAVEIVFFRTLIAFVALGLLLYLQKMNFRVGAKEILKMLSTGLLMSAHWILFFAAARISTVSVTLAGMATCSLWTSFIEPVLTHRKIKWFEVALGSMGMIGLYVIFQFEFDHALGLTMSLVAAFLSALFTVINGKFSVRHNHYMITFYEMIGAFLGTVLFLPFYIRYFAPDGVLHLAPNVLDWLYLSLLALVCTVYAYSVAVQLMQKISAFVINLTVNLEPIYGIILAVIIFGDDEKMTDGFYVGTLIILASVLIYPILNRLHKRKALETDIWR